MPSILHKTLSDRLRHKTKREMTEKYENGPHRVKQNKFPAYVFDMGDLERSLKNVAKRYGESAMNEVTKKNLFSSEEIAFLARIIYNDITNNRGIKTSTQNAWYRTPFYEFPTFVDLNDLLGSELAFQNVVDYFAWCCVTIHNVRKLRDAKIISNFDDLWRMESFEYNNRVRELGLMSMIESTTTVAQILNFYGVFGPVDEIADPGKKGLFFGKNPRTAKMIGGEENDKNLKMMYPLLGATFDKTMSGDIKKMNNLQYAINKEDIPSSEEIAKKLDTFYSREVSGPIVMPLRISTHFLLNVYDPVRRICSFYEPMGIAHTKPNSRLNSTKYEFWRGLWLAYFRLYLGHHLDNASEYKRFKMGLMTQSSVMSFYDCVSLGMLDMKTRNDPVPYKHQFTEGHNCGPFVCYYIMKICLEKMEYIPTKNTSEKWLGKDENCNSDYMSWKMRPSLYAFFAAIYKEMNALHNQEQLKSKLVNP